MKIIDLIRLLRKHIVLLLVTPILLAGLVVYLTRKPDFKYASETTLYTGLATGSSVEMDKSFNYFATNTAFDNLINVIKSRETQQELVIRLLAQHLMLPNYDVRYISSSSYDNLKQITPAYINSLVVKSADHTQGSVNNALAVTKKDSLKDENSQNAEKQIHIVNINETLFSISQKYHVSVDQIKMMNGLKNNNVRVGQSLIVGKLLDDFSKSSKIADTILVPKLSSDTSATFSFSDLNNSGLSSNTLPPSINAADYEQTVKNLTDYMASSDTNFVYRLLNFEDPHYSIQAISSINVQRIANSDMVKLKYETDDPGICQQTLALLTDVCIKNYKGIKENRSDAVVKYFEFQLKQAAGRLKVAEDKLLKFNKDNNIINYYEQSKAVAVVKEDLDVEFNNKRIKLAGIQAGIKGLEEKLGIQQQIQLKSSNILEKRNELGEVNYKILSAEILGAQDVKNGQQLVDLKNRAEKLKNEIKSAVGEFYSFSNSKEGLPISTILNDWISNVIEAENTKAGIDVLGERIKEFQKQYAVYAPAGANIKRIEREISVSEQEFLEILHGLNLAKLKMQDNELSSNIKAVDPPYFPVSPIPTKRKILIVVAGLLGFMIVLTTVFVLEYFDDTLRNQTKASRILKLEFLSAFPKIMLKVQNTNFLFITNRLLEIAIQNIERYLSADRSQKTTKTLLIFSTLRNEGKTVIIGNLAQKLKKQGKKVFVLNFTYESLRKTEVTQIGYPDIRNQNFTTRFTNKRRKFSVINWLLGYPDTRINYDSPFLQHYENVLDEHEFMYYNVDESFYSVNNYKEILALNNYYLSFTPDFVLIELPPILFYPYPVGLLSDTDMSILICRSNRIWSEADQGALDVLTELTKQKTHFLLNGVELQVIESILGDLPKKRSWLRRKLKSVFRLQFFSRNQI